MDIETYEHPILTTFRAAHEAAFLAAIEAEIVPLCGTSMFGGSCQYAWTESGLDLSVYTQAEIDYWGDRAGSYPPSHELDAAVKALGARFGFVVSEWEEEEKGWGHYTLSMATVTYHIFVDGTEDRPWPRHTIHTAQVAARRARDANPGAHVSLSRRCSPAA